ncbi:MAG: TonB-dependent receptor [Candidatus Hydrothermales bacterium]
MIFLNFLLASITISGRVIDKKSGEFIPFVFVYIKDDKKGTFTDERGFYVIQRLKEGKVTICYKIVGYEEKCIDLEMKRGESKVLNVELNPIEIEVEKIIIYSRKKEFEEEPASIIKRETSLFRKLPKFFEGDLLRTISFLPGVVQFADLSSRFSVRGGSPQENLTFLDEIPIYNPYHLGGLFSIFDLSALSKYEFYRGAYPASYGNALSSILCAELKTGNLNRLYFEYLISFLSLRFLSEGPFLKGSYLIFLRRTYFDKYLKLINRSFELPYHFFDILFSYNIQVLTNLRFKLSYFLNRDLYYKADELILLKWGNDGFSLKAFYIKGKNFHEISLFLSFFFNFFKYSDFMDLWNPISIKGFKWKGEYKGSFDKVFGIEYENLAGKFQNDIFGLKQFEKGNPHILCFFTELNFKFKKFRFIPGIRANYFYLRIKENPKRNTESFTIEPRINIKYLLNDKIAIKSAFGIFNQYLVAVSFSKVFDPFYYWITIFGDYKPMNSKHYIAGISYLPDWGKIDFEIFYKKYDYILEYRFRNFDPLNPDETIFSDGYGESYGFDFFVEKTFGNFKSNITLTVLKSHGKFKGEKFYHPLRWDRTFNFSSNFLYKIFKDFDLGANFFYTSGSPFTDLVKRYRFFYPPYPGNYPEVIWEEIESNPFGKRFPPYHRLDISISKNFKIKKISGYLSLSIINVYNRKNILLYYYDYKKDPPLRKELYQLPFIPSFEIILNF